jgi:hypothetical protein
MMYCLRGRADEHRRREANHYTLQVMKYNFLCNVNDFYIDSIED